jgi:hypothetical protein
VVAGRKEQSGCDNSTLLGKRGLDSASSTAVEQGDSGAKEARKRCYCGAASCTGYLPYSAFDS